MGALLDEMHADRRQRREAMRIAMVGLLRAALGDLLPAGSRVWVFGSLLRPGRFHEESDVDVAIEELPPGRTEAWLMGELEHRLSRAVDVLNLGETGLRDSIERRGQAWTL